MGIKTKFEDIDKIAIEIAKIKNVRAVYLFGSYALGKQNALSDIDLCIVGNLTTKEKRDAFHSSDNLDISFFNELPIWIKTRIFRDGKPIVIKNEKEIYDLAFTTLREWEDFRPLLNKRVFERFGKCMT
jgi:predicted nucleotidyltransferase